MVDIEQIKRELDIIRAQLRVDCPFLASLTSKVRIGADENIEYGACDIDGVIWIGKKFMELPVKQRLYVLGHEVLHAALQHAARRADRNPELWNISADVIVNEALNKAGVGEFPPFGVRGDHLPLPEGWEHWSVEQVYRWLEQNTAKVRLEWADLLGEGEQGGKSKGERTIIQQGEPELYGEGEAQGRKQGGQGEEVAKRTAQGVAGGEDGGEVSCRAGKVAREPAQAQDGHSSPFAVLHPGGLGQVGGHQLAPPEQKEPRFTLGEEAHDSHDSRVGGHFRLDRRGGTLAFPRNPPRVQEPDGDNGDLLGR
jgi:hypothetical protein